MHTQHHASKQQGIRPPNDPKRHHTIAEMLQKRFTDADHMLWFFDRRRHDKAIVYSQPENLFVSKHFYSKYNLNGKRDAALEKDFAVLEGRVDLILELIVRSVRTGTGLVLSDDQRLIIDKFVIAQLKRSPEMRDRLERHTPFQLRVTDAIATLETTQGPISAALKASLFGSDFMRIALQNSAVHAIGSDSPRLHKAMRSRGLLFARLDDPNAAFVLGSDPFARFGPRGDSHLGNAEVQMYFPIAPDIALLSYGGADVSGLALVPAAAVGIVNRIIAQRSNVIASSSRDLVRTLSEQFCGRPPDAPIFGV